MDTATKRSYRTQSQTGDPVRVLSGWDTDAKTYRLVIRELPKTQPPDRTPEERTVYDSSEDAERRLSFSDLTFVLCTYGLWYPDRWAQRLLADHPDLPGLDGVGAETEYGFHPALKPTPRR